MQNFHRKRDICEKMNISSCGL